MKFTNEDLSLENALTKEWLITNGIGGFSSSTIIGANTRKYHGLLIAPLTPPARRHLILSKLDESIEINGRAYGLYTNVCKNYISEGFKHQISFEKEYIPVFKYKVEDVEIEKQICMQYGKNTVCILYKIKNNNSYTKLTLAPVVNFKDFHTMTTNQTFEIKQQNKNNKVKIVVNNHNETPIYMNLSEGIYIPHNNDIFYNMHYIEEEKRGFFPEENHVVPGRFEVFIPANTEKEISFVCSLDDNIEEIDCNKVIEQEIERLEKVIQETGLISNKTEDTEFIKNLIIASDNFIVYRPSFKLHTIIAGYPWFLDWGRDTLISFEGLLLVTKRYELAKEVLQTIVRDVKYGLVPNGYSGFDNRPLYNSVDSSLLLFEQVHKYIEYTKDEDFIKENIYEILKNVIDAYVAGIDVDDNNIYLDKDGLLVSGTDSTQNTWMDAKIGNFVVTPRNGKAVEINSLWYNALKILEELSEKFGEPYIKAKCSKLAKKCKLSFNKKFYQEKKKCLYDVLGDTKIRPNQLFSLSLTYQIVDPGSDMAKDIIDTVNKKLLKKNGLKTLAKGEKDYIEVYEGDSFKRDMSYHQGITWVWLLGIYNNALKNRIKSQKSQKERKILEEEYQKFLSTTKKTFETAVFKEGCIGSISELYDSKPPYLPKGAIAQAWSVAEILRIIVQGEEK